ncbi:MAG: hypothetical protein ABWY35_11505 [Pseudorhodoplanes sp.]
MGDDPIVKKRCVFFLGGYEPIPPERQRERYVRELARSAKTWAATAEVGPLEMSPDRLVGLWRIDARGPNWATHAEYHSLLWDDMVIEDFARPAWKRLLLAVRAFGDFLVTGTAFRYLMVNWRYGLFFFYPVLLLLGFAAVAAFAAHWLVGVGMPVPWVSAPIAAIAFFALLLMWPGRFLLLDYMMDDWIFGWQVVHRSRPGLDARMEGFAKELAHVMRSGGYDEVLFAAHSLGCAIKIAVIDRALQLVPEFGRNGETLSVLSTGSSLLKIAFHPKGGWLREAVRRVSATRSVFWIDYQTMADPISFYNVDTLKALGLPETGSPIVRRVHIRDMLEAKTYRRFKANFFRLHRQLVMGNEKRYFYDYYMICCGPLRLETRVLKPETIVARFTEDGALKNDEQAAGSHSKAVT